MFSYAMLPARLVLCRNVCKRMLYTILVYIYGYVLQLRPCHVCSQGHHRYLVLDKRRLYPLFQQPTISMYALVRIARLVISGDGGALDP